MAEHEKILTIPNAKTDKKWTSFEAIGIAEGFIDSVNAQEVPEAWAVIIKYELWKGLQGWFGRTVNNLIEQGIISEDGTIDWELTN